MEQIGGATQRIRPVNVIGEGRHGQVFVGFDETLRRRVILKRLARTSFASPETRRRLIEEARTLSRIDHSNILRIHDYSESGGEDVFTIEFAPGRSLPDALADGLDFAKKVRIATAVASALAVAHRNGVVHGALSPDSVVITESDEIKIVDFTSTSTRLEGPRTRPEWQSPEEQRGAEATRAGDMYAFGLLMRAMFGEKDRDVRAIVASLLREAPSERATAAVTLTGLYRLARRRARRLRAAAVPLLIALVAGGAVKYTVDLRRERSEALAAKAEADARRAEANELLTFMILDLQPKLGSVGRLDIMDAASEKALDYLASVDPEQISASEAAVHVQALVQLALNQRARADFRTAMKTSRLAVSIGDTMLRRQPDNNELRYATAHAHGTLGGMLEKEGDLAGALVHARAHVTASEDLARRAPRELRFLRTQAYAHSNLGRLHDRREEIAAALRELEVAIEIKRRILPLEDTAETRADLAFTVHKAGLMQFELGRFAEARRTLEKDRGELEALLVRDSRNQRIRQTMASFEETLSGLELAAGDLSAASRYAAAHLATGTQLAAFDPDNVDWIRNVVIAHCTSGTIARLRGDAGAALQHHSTAVDVLTGVFARGRHAKPLIRDMAMIRVEHARSLLAAGLPAAASEEAHRAVEELRPVLRGELQAQAAFAEALLVEGETRAARGDSAGASALWQEALRIAAPLDELSPDPRIADTHARILLRLGRRDRAQPLIEGLAALGYRHPEFETLSGENGVSIPDFGKLKGER